LPNIPDLFKGCFLFPCVAGAKVPAIEGGWKNASADPAQWEQWERDYPGCNWAVATGLSGLFVIDIDPEGLETWERMQDGNSDLREAIKQAYTVRTPRGGLHHYWRGSGPSTASRIAAGIDTRGGIRTDSGDIKSGGYVLLPGSRTQAGTYREIGGRLLSLPGIVRGIVPERKKAETKGLERDPSKDQPRNVQWSISLLQSYVKDGRVSIEGKGGNDTAFQVAASVLDKAISPALALDLLEEHWNPHCQPPWDDWELERIVSNAASYGEDARSGSKGFQSNAEAFASFMGKGEPEPAAPSERPRDKLMWLHDYADSVEDPTWLIPGVLPARGTGMIYGASGSYKSFLILDMALSLAYGRAGQWGAPPVRNDVLFLAGEGPVATAKKRWPAWLEWQGIEQREAHRIILKNRVPFYHDTEAWEHVRVDLDQLGARPSLIVIDTLSRLLTGMDENSTKDATMVVSFMEQLAQHYECFVLAIHHTGKDENKGARGSSVFHANMDTVIATRKRQEGTELRVKKQKDADIADEPFYFQVKEVANSIVLEKVDTLAEAPKPGKSRMDWSSAEEITSILNSHGGEMSLNMLASEIAKKVGADAGHIRRKLAASKDLDWLRDGNTWRIPRQEYDL